MMSENCARIYITETKIVSLSSLARAMKKRGIKKIRLTFCKSLKTHEEKMPIFCLSIMLMKKHKLNRSLHYVDENKGS
jgi:hypothetical protein